MEENEIKNKVGRPKFQIDYEIVKKLAGIMCTQEEIAAFLGCHVRTLLRDEEFCQTYKEGLFTGKMSIRRYQMAAAKKGNSSLLIWLGKQYLGQRDYIEDDDDKYLEEKIDNWNNATSYEKKDLFDDVEISEKE